MKVRASNGKNKLPPDITYISCFLLPLTFDRQRKQEMEEKMYDVLLWLCFCGHSLDIINGGPVEKIKRDGLSVRQNVAIN